MFRLIEAEFAAAGKLHRGDGSPPLFVDGGELSAFFRDILGFKSVDAGHGWLIFALPPTEAAFHPSEGDVHELYFMCDDLKTEMASLAKKGVKCSKVEEARWGSVTKMRLPSGGKVGLYQPKHPAAIAWK